MGLVGLIWVMFAVLGVGLWKGKFYYCTDSTQTYDAMRAIANRSPLSTRATCNGTYVDASGAVVPRAWETNYVNFNNAGEVRTQKLRARDCEKREIETRQTDINFSSLQVSHVFRRRS
jgi:hypothetical protein